jgi:putative DNA primase/helicase
MMWTNYDEVISTLVSHDFVVSSLDIGSMKRVKRDGHDQKGWYVLHEIRLDDGGAALIGSFGYFNGSDPYKEKIAPGKGVVLSKEQQAAIRAQHAEATKKAEQQRQHDSEVAARQATNAWSKYVPEGESDYLKRKGVLSFGLRFAPSGNGTVAIPMQDAMGKTWGLQIIRGKDRGTKLEKQYWPKGLDKKSHYYLIGGTPKGVLLVGEGYATCATLHQATGLPVAVAFDAGNLQPVALALHKKYPRVKILVCADDDYLSEGNPGVKAAESAAIAVGGAWIKPAFPFDREGKKLTDFNDLANFDNFSESTVRVQIEQKLTELGWGGVSQLAGARQQGGGGVSAPTENKGTLKPLIDVGEAVERFSLIYGAGGTMYDHQEAALIPKSDVLDICVDHAWREWKLHPMRSVVRLSEVGFDPTEKDQNIICNLWGGWPTKPKHGQCDILLNLLRYLCQGEEKDHGEQVYQWVLKWLAYPIQNHGAKMRSALIFHGPQGAGKNLFFEAYAAIFGKYSRIVGQAEIDDKFNDWASGKLFMIADEVVARQELFHIKNKLKALITGETIRINPKNVAAHDERNHVNIVFLSNEKQPLVLEKDDRRYMVIWTPEKLSKNVYADIAEEIAAGGIEALHDYLLHLDLGDFNQYTEPLITASKQDLIDINLESGERFISDWLGGDLDLPVCPCMSEDLYKAYNEWCKRNGVVRPRELNQFIGNIAKTKGFKRERARIHKDYTYSSDLVQRNVICPPPERYQDSHQLSHFKNTNQWFTTCVLDFKETLRGKNDQND